MLKSRLYLLSPFRKKIRFLLTLFGLFLARNMAGSQVKVSESKLHISYFTHTIPGQLPVKKVWFQHFPVGHFRNILTSIFKFGCFSWCHVFIFEKNKLHILMQNLMLNRLAPISNSKNEKPKSLYALF